VLAAGSNERALPGEAYTFDIDPGGKTRLGISGIHGADRRAPAIEPTWTCSRVDT
jgi:hypothetical protein